jgi:hypothetical protein
VRKAALGDLPNALPGAMSNALLAAIPSPVPDGRPNRLSGAGESKRAGPGSSRPNCLRNSMFSPFGGSVRQLECSLRQARRHWLSWGSDIR